MLFRRFCSLIPFAIAAAVVIAAREPKNWTMGAVLLHPGPPASFDAVAVKDPSIVRYRDRWHLFYTARNQTDYMLATLAHQRCRRSSAQTAIPSHNSMLRNRNMPQLRKRSISGLRRSGT